MRRAVRLIASALETNCWRARSPTLTPARHLRGWATVNDRRVGEDTTRSTVASSRPRPPDGAARLPPSFHVLGARRQDDEDPHLSEHVTWPATRWAYVAIAILLRVSNGGGAFCGAVWGHVGLRGSHGRPLLSCLTRERRQHGSARIRLRDYFCPAASRIRSAIASGCEMRPRWLAFTSMVFAPMRFAMKRCRSGLMVRSSVDTA